MSPYLKSYSKPLTDLAEVHLGRRDEATNFNLQLWEVIGMDYSEKVTYAQERVNEEKIEDNFLQSVANQILPHIMKCLLIMNEEEEH